MKVDERGITLHQTKRCGKCDGEYPLDRFHKFAKSRDGLSGWCKPCANAYHRQYQIGKGDGKQALYTRANRYQLTEDRLVALLGGGCFICGRVDKKMHIDHDHACCAGHRSCGKCVRGALCVRCNIGLGIFGDSLEGLSKAVAYLEGGYIEN